MFNLKRALIPYPQILEDYKENLVIGRLSQPKFAMTIAANTGAQSYPAQNNSSSSSEVGGFTDLKIAMDALTYKKIVRTGSKMVFALTFLLKMRINYQHILL